MGAWLATADAAEALGWGQRKERDRRLAELGLDDSKRDPAELLRLVVTHGSDAAPEVARLYLERLLSSSGAHHTETVAILPRLEPRLFAELAARVMIFERRDEPYAASVAVSRGYGLRDTTKLFPSAPGRAGFDALFAADEAAALGLLGQFCSVASEQWRLQQQERRFTPRPIRLDLPDGPLALGGGSNMSLNGRAAFLSRMF